MTCKQSWSGGQLVYVDPKHTSQMYPECQHTAQKNRLTQEKFECVRCGYAHNVDVVGALNILVGTLRISLWRGCQGKGFGKDSG